MTEARFVHEGKMISYMPSADITAGTVIVLGDLIAITLLDLAVGVLGALAVEGVFEVAKATGAGTELTAGTIVYWDGTNKIVATTDGGGTHKRMGYVVDDAGQDDTVALVKLSRG